jgi:hypothetical protein
VELAFTLAVAAGGVTTLIVVLGILQSVSPLEYVQQL